MSDLIGVMKAVILWDTGDDGMAKNVLVVEGRGQSLPQRYSSGCVYQDWMKGSRGMTPEFVFSELLAFYGMKKAEAENAIAQFAKIDSCDWARKMVPSK